MRGKLKREDLKGRVLTVRGLINPEDMGITLTHEHLLIELPPYFSKESPPLGERRLVEEKVSPKNRLRVQKNFPMNKDNLRIDDKEVVIQELKDYISMGGRSLVDVTSIGLRRDPLAISQIAHATNLNIIMGAGFYVKESHPSWIRDCTESEITEKLVGEIVKGEEKYGIHPGVIGEIGLHDPIADDEKKVLRAAVAAQNEIGVPILIHPSEFVNCSNIGLEAVDILENEGANFEQVIISHMDHRLAYEDNVEYQKSVAERGPYIAIDNWGGDWYMPYCDWECATDQRRVEALMDLIDSGYTDKILLSHDICCKAQLKKYGGLGFDHLFRNIVPRLRKKGLSDKIINKIFVENPKEAFQFR